MNERTQENTLQEYGEYEKLLTNLEKSHQKSTRRMYIFFWSIVK